MTPAVRLHRVSVAYAACHVLHEVSLSIDSGEVVGIVGSSGAGKTTLLRIINATKRPTEGWVEVGGERVSRLVSGRVRQLRAAIGFIHQDFALIPNLTVAQNVVAGRLGRLSLARSVLAMWWPSQTLLCEVHRLLEDVGIADKMFERVDRLSGGQQQRVAIARAVFQQPLIICADEPVSNLDPSLARGAMELLTALVRRSSLTLCVALHDVALASEFCTRLVGMQAGRVAFDIPSTEVTPARLAELYAAVQPAAAA